MVNCKVVANFVPDVKVLCNQLRVWSVNELLKGEFLDWVAIVSAAIAQNPPIGRRLHPDLLCEEDQSVLVRSRGERLHRRQQGGRQN
jgi:hypothetical protein